MKRYEVVPSRFWQHTSGAKASIYGACPWTNDADKPNWQMVATGYTIMDNRTNSIGGYNSFNGGQPFSSVDAVVRFMEANPTMFKGDF